MAAGLFVLVLIAESMGSLIETGINDLGLPSSLGGLLVGVLVIAPEALNALQAAGKGELQRSLNTLYGSSLSTLCLTVPAVLAIGEFTGTDVILGLDPLESVLLVQTLILVRPISGRVSHRWPDASHRGRGLGSTRGSELIPDLILISAPSQQRS